jgi:hypothetical protein
MSWATVYASLPVLRVTVVRDPFSWLMSKYSWHFNYRTNKTVNCDDLEGGIHGGKNELVGARQQLIGMDSVAAGWIRRMSLGYIMHVCGQPRLHYSVCGRTIINPRFGKKAVGNLRNSFSVVGILQDTDTFYEMVSARVGYIDTSLNPQVQGPQHRSRTSEALSKCKVKLSAPEHRN